MYKTVTRLYCRNFYGPFASGETKNYMYKIYDNRFLLVCIIKHCLTVNELEETDHFINIALL